MAKLVIYFILEVNKMKSYSVINNREEALLIERIAKRNKYKIYPVKVEKGINPLDCIKKQYPEDNNDKCGYCEIKFKDADFTVLLNDVTNKLYYFSEI